MKKIINKVLGIFKKKPVVAPNKKEEEPVVRRGPLYEYRTNK